MRIFDLLSFILDDFFAGQLKGFLAWGFLILYIALVLVGFVIFFAVKFFNLDWIIDNLLQYLIPLVTVYVIKLTLRTIIVYFFVVSDSKILAINNFRAYTITSYFMFFFDLFFGFLNAIIRLLKGLVVSAFMMSRKFSNQLLFHKY